MSTDGPINLAFEANHYSYVNVNHFSNYIVNVPTPENVVHYDVSSLIHHCKSKIGPLYNLITDRGTHYINEEVAKCRFFFNSGNFQRTSHAPWTIGIVDEQKNLELF